MIASRFGAEAEHFIDQFANGLAISMQDDPMLGLVIGYRIGSVKRHEPVASLVTLCLRAEHRLTGRRCPCRLPLRGAAFQTGQEVGGGGAVHDSLAGFGEAVITY